MNQRRHSVEQAKDSGHAAPADVWAQNGPESPPVCSGTLLNGRTSVAIDHEGTRYVLRATRTGKLILTK